MGTAGSENVPVTREGALNVLKLLMIVLAAAIFWQAAAAVNAEFQARDLITAPPFLKGALRLLIGTEAMAPFQVRLSEFWSANHRPAALVMMLVSTVVLVIRYLFIGRALDFLYLESAQAPNRRVHSGFVAHIAFLLAHAGAIYGVVFFSRGGHVTLVPMAMLVLLVFNLLWIGGILATADHGEKRALRGLWYLGATALAAAVVLLGAALVIEVSPPVRGSVLVILSAGIALALCLADGYLQSRVYRWKPEQASE